MRSLAYIWQYDRPGYSMSQVGTKKDNGHIGYIGVAGRSSCFGEIGNLLYENRWIYYRISNIGLLITDQAPDIDTRGTGSIGLN